LLKCLRIGIDRKVCGLVVALVDVEESEKESSWLENKKD
jgi:hypothetical protein